MLVLLRHPLRLESVAKCGKLVVFVLFLGQVALRERPRRRRCGLCLLLDMITAVPGLTQ